MMQIGRRLVQRWQTPLRQWLLTKETPLSKQLDYYDLVVIGHNNGCVLANRVIQKAPKNFKILVVNEQNLLQFYYSIYLSEYNVKQKVLLEYYLSILLPKRVASIIGSVSKINPEESSISIKDRNIKYGALVVAAGLRSNYKNIEGFYQAWEDQYYTFFSCIEVPTTKNDNPKRKRAVTQMTHGDAYFYIPSPFRYGDIDYFKFLSEKTKFDRYVKADMLSWNTSSYTVINEGYTFSEHYPAIDQYFRNNIVKKNIKLEEGLSLIKVNKHTNEAVFRHNRSGALITKVFSRMYALMPCVPNPLISKELADERGLLDCDPYTMKSKRYDNIYGLGDIANFPTSRTWGAGLNQARVLAHNLCRRFSGQQEDARYDGYSFSFFEVEQLTYATLQHNYQGIISINDSSIGKKLNSIFFKKLHPEKFYSGKSCGPPYFFFEMPFKTPTIIENFVDVHPAPKVEKVKH